ncbi:DUF1772 domain-containing protein, partial [Burkholderia multivorans]
LNQRLDQAPIDTNADCSVARVGFEATWNRCNLVRCVGNIVAVLALSLG